MQKEFDRDLSYFISLTFRKWAKVFILFILILLL